MFWSYVEEAPIQRQITLGSACVVDGPQRRQVLAPDAVVEKPCSMVNELGARITESQVTLAGVERMAFANVAAICHFETRLAQVFQTCTNKRADMARILFPQFKNSAKIRKKERNITYWTSRASMIDAEDVVVVDLGAADARACDPRIGSIFS